MYRKKICVYAYKDSYVNIHIYTHRYVCHIHTSILGVVLKFPRLRPLPLKAGAIAGMRRALRASILAAGGEAAEGGAARSLPGSGPNRLHKA